MQGLEFERLLFSAFIHADEMHVGYNMSSFLWKVNGYNLAFVCLTLLLGSPACGYFRSRECIM